MPAFASVGVGVREVVFEVLRKFECFEAVKVEPFLRDFPGDVGAEKAKREEEGFFAGFAELRDGPVGAEWVAAVFTPGGGIVLGITRSPLQGVEDLATTCSVGAVVFEMLGKDDGVLEDGRFIAPARAVGPEGIAVDAGATRVDTSHDGHARGVAGGCRAVGVGKSDGTFGEAIEVRGFDAGVVRKGRDVIVQVINRDEENVGFFRILSCGQCARALKKEKGNDEESLGGKEVFGCSN